MTAATADAAPDAETAIRSYLSFLDDPTSLVDTQRAAALDQELAATTDPIRRLRLLADLLACRTPDCTTLRAGFVRSAKAWAEAQGIPAEAFRQLGVPEADLRAAGWSIKRSSADRLAAVRSGVTAGEIQRHIAGLDGPFTMGDIAAQVGGSPMTLRKAIRAMLADGRVERLSPAPSQTRGRAPTRYRTVPARRTSEPARPRPSTSRRSDVES